MNKHIIVYKQNESDLECDTQYIGPFDTFDVAYDAMYSLPAGWVKYVQELKLTATATTIREYDFTPKTDKNSGWLYTQRVVEPIKAPWAYYADEWAGMDGQTLYKALRAKTGECWTMDSRTDQLFYFVDAKQPINAIKEYRRLTGSGLKTSKDAVDKLTQYLNY